MSGTYEGEGESIDVSLPLGLVVADDGVYSSLGEWQGREMSPSPLYRSCFSPSGSIRQCIRWSRLHEDCDLDRFAAVADESAYF